MTPEEYRARIARGMTEADLAEEVRGLARALGVTRYHTFDSRRSEPGFPDEVLIGDAGVLFRELKSERGRVTPDQQRVLARLTGAGQDAAVWRPRHWLDGTITSQMRGIAARHG